MSVKKSFQATTRKTDASQRWRCTMLGDLCLEKACFGQLLGLQRKTLCVYPTSIPRKLPIFKTSRINPPEKSIHHPRKHAVHSIFCISLNQPSLGRHRWKGQPVKLPALAATSQVIASCSETSSYDDSMTPADPLDAAA